VSRAEILKLFFFFNYTMEELEENRNQLSKNGNQFDALRKIKKRKVKKERAVPLVEAEKEEPITAILETITTVDKGSSSSIIYYQSDNAERYLTSCFDKLSGRRYRRILSPPQLILHRPLKSNFA
jgi:hypothetical protein